MVSIYIKQKLNITRLYEYISLLILKPYSLCHRWARPKQKCSVKQQGSSGKVLGSRSNGRLIQVWHPTKIAYNVIALQPYHPTKIASSLLSLQLWHPTKIASSLLSLQLWQPTKIASSYLSLQPYHPTKIASSLLSLQP